MAASYNKVILAGNLTRDPEVKYLPGGSAVAEIGLAVNRTWFDKKANEKKEECDFIDVTYFGKTAEVIGQYMKKGSSILCECRLKLDMWDDRETGKKRSKLKVIGEQMQMLGSRGDNSGRREQTRSEEPSGPAIEDPFDGDDVPF